MKKMHIGMSILAVMAAAGSSFAQANDSCETPDPISGFGAFVFDTTAATSSALSIGCAAGEAYNDVWFCWTAIDDGPVVIDTCGGDVFHDSVIAVYDACGCPAAGSEIACNDDSCGFQSSVSFLATAGQTYLVRLGGYSEGEIGGGTLRVQSGILHTAEFNGHTYQLFAANSWTEAEALAVVLGGHLVTINDAAENEFVQFSVLGFDGIDRRTWIGFNDAANEGTFEWSSGEPAKYTNWNAGEPNDFGGNEDYTEMLGGNGQWNDQPDGGNGFVRFGIVEIGTPACTADFNNDDVVNSQDFFDFLTAFFDTHPSADFNNDSVINSQDFFDFLTAFFEGC